VELSGCENGIFTAVRCIVISVQNFFCIDSKDVRHKLVTSLKFPVMQEMSVPSSLWNFLWFSIRFSSKIVLFGNECVKIIQKLNRRREFSTSVRYRNNSVWLTNSINQESFYRNWYVVDKSRQYCHFMKPSWQEDTTGPCPWASPQKPIPPNHFQYHLFLKTGDL